MLTTFDVDEYVFEALRAGASGFLLKDAPAEELAAAIRVFASGDSLLAPLSVLAGFAAFMASNVTWWGCAITAVCFTVFAVALERGARPTS